MKKIIFLSALFLLNSAFAEQQQNIGDLVNAVKDKTKQLTQNMDKNSQKSSNEIEENLLNEKPDPTFGGYPTEKAEENSQKNDDNFTAYSPSNNATNNNDTQMDLPPQNLNSSQEKKRQTNQAKQVFKYEPPVGVMRKEMSAEIDVGFLKKKISVLTFPFLITGYEVTDFIRNKDDKKDRKTPDKVDIQIQNNRIILKSATSGKMDLIVKGGAYPILVHIIFNVNTGEQYIAVVDEKLTKKIKKLNADNHTEMLVGITTALYLDEKVVGFKINKTKEFFELKDYALELIKTKTMVGQGYIGEVWKITNKDPKESINLSEEMFFTDGVYLISLTGNIVKPNKSVTMYVVRKAE